MHAMRASLLLVVSSVFCAGTALAQSPVNDEWSGRIAIPVGTLAAGFADSQTGIGDASTDASDPLLVCKAFGDPLQRGNTVWYQLDLSAQAQPLYLNLGAGGYDSVVAVFVGNPVDGFAPVPGACNDDGAPAFAAQLNGARLPAGRDYSIMVARQQQNSAPITLSFSARSAPLYTVSKTTDTSDGVCDADCSLREAISASNTAPGAILLAAGDYQLSRTGSDNTNINGDLDVIAGAGIYGVGPATRILGLGSAERVFELDPVNPTNIGATYNFADLLIGNGAGIGPGAGIRADNGNDHVALNRVTLENNNATLLSGGGMSSNGPTVVIDSVVRNNSASSSGGGLAFSGTNANTRVDVVRSTIAGNSSSSASSGGGGGIYGQTNLFLVDSTVSGNQARFNGGGVISTTSTGRLTLLNSTVVGNRADSDANGTGIGGGIRMEGNTAALYNSVGAANLANATADDCSKTPGLTAVTLIHNHMEAAAGAASNCGFAAGSNNIEGVPALLAALADNGGPGQTHYPLPGSPLIDSGDASTCTTSDQLGTDRPLDGDAVPGAVCDRGAVEFDPATVVVDPIFDDGFEQP